MYYELAEKKIDETFNIIFAINSHGEFLNDKEFFDICIFHKNYATAKDKGIWHHIDKKGIELYPERYLMVEPFYNGYSVVDTFANTKQIIDEKGNVIRKFKN